MAMRVAALAVAGLGALAVILFGVAGRTDWIGAWILLALSAAFFLVAGSAMARRNPDLARERLKAGGPSAPGDAQLLTIYRLLIVALFGVAALDAGRYRWSHVPLAVMVVGGIAMMTGFAVVWWCSATNAYLSSVVRIQSDRGQRVIDGGPYAYVRHPMYAALVVLTAGMALLLGSWLALAPAGLVVVVLGARIRLEERVLTAGLDGYAAYAARVTARLVPGVW
jgi:protein-S-isoprenylcysteine O-methyltransferase Ste14